MTFIEKAEYTNRARSVFEQVLPLEVTSGQTIDWGLMLDNLLLEAMPARVKSLCVAQGREFRIADSASMRFDDADGRQVFIVTEGVASMMLRSPLGKISEIGMIGREGMFPIAALLDVPAKHGIVVAQLGELAGVVLRTEVFNAIIAPYPAAGEIVRKFVYSFAVQITTSLMSSEQDSAERRVARWLLMSHDRTDGDIVPVTHDMLAQMAFSHRPTVTNVLRDLKHAGIVDTGRGNVTIIDRQALKHLAGGTYGHAEAYWDEHIGPFGKDRPTDQEPLHPPLRAAAR